MSTLTHLSVRLQRPVFAVLCAFVVSFVAYLASFGGFYLFGLWLKPLMYDRCSAYAIFSYFASMHVRVPLALPLISVAAAIGSTVVDSGHRYGERTKTLLLAGGIVFGGFSVVFFSRDPYITSPCKQYRMIMAFAQSLAEIALVYIPAMYLALRVRPTIRRTLALIVLVATGGCGLLLAL